MDPDKLKNIALFFIAAYAFTMVATSWRLLRSGNSKTLWFIIPFTTSMAGLAVYLMIKLFQFNSPQMRFPIKIIAIIFLVIIIAVLMGALKKSRPNKSTLPTGDGWHHISDPADALLSGILVLPFIAFIFYLYSRHPIVITIMSFVVLISIVFQVTRIRFNENSLEMVITTGTRFKLRFKEVKEFAHNEWRGYISILALKYRMVPLYFIIDCNDPDVAKGLIQKLETGTGRQQGVPII